MKKDIKLPPFSAATIFFSGSQHGCLKIEVKSHIIIYQIEHDTIDAIKDEDEDELKNAGIYLLVNDEKNTLYVGQAIKRQNGDGLLGRILESHASPEIDNWQYAYALTSNTSRFLGDGELCYLEQFFYDEAKAFGHYRLLNSKRPTSSGVNAHVKLHLEEYVSYAFFLLENPLMRRIFEPRFQQKPETPKPPKSLAKSLDNNDSVDSTASTGSTANPVDSAGADNADADNTDNTDNADANLEKHKSKKTKLSQEVIGKRFYLKNVSKNVNALGVMSDTKAITVRTGATVCQNNTLPNQKGQEHAASKRQELIDKGVISDFTFVKDYQFSSTTIAASVLLGQSANGITAWKDEAGKELKSYALSTENL